MYYTIDKEIITEFVVDKSRFISHMRPVETEEEANAYIQSIRKKHYNATHNVPVYVIGENYEIQKCSDDGEPAKTAGVPVLELFKKRGITNVCIVITRYFGGIKLGTGGLVRAYTHAAQLAIDEGGLKRVDEYAKARWKYEYGYHDKIRHLLEPYFHKVIEIRYSDVIEMDIVMNVEEYDFLFEKLIELTSNQLKSTKKEIIRMMI